jgi:GPH family glycoside/pentoside/hexuronide:cation symporter
MTDATPSHDRVPVMEKLALGVGALAAFFGYAGVSVLAYPVYNMMLGVSTTWIGAALMIPRIWDGLIDPIVGRFSDNCHSRFGRRKPFIVVGAIAMGLTFGLIWFVPPAWSNTMKMAYFIALQLLFFTAYAVFAVPYNALTYEMTPDYHERTRVMAFTAFFHKLGELTGGWMLPLAGLLSAALVVGSTDLNMTGVRAMGWMIGIVIMAGIGMVPGLFVRERFATKTQHQSKVGIWDSLKGAMESTAFLALVAIIVLNTLSGVLAMGIDQYLLVYFMNNGDKAAGLLQKGLLTTGYGVVGFAAIPIITWLAGKFGKSGSLYFVYSLMVFGGIMKWFIFTPGHPIFHLGKIAIDPVILIDPLLCGPMWVGVKIMLASMMADICDEDELKHSQRREGLFGGVFAWIEKMVLSLAYLGTGLALSFAHFNPTLGGNQSPETFTRMRLFLASAPALTAVFALVALKFYPITATRAAATRKQLEARRGTVEA